MYLSRLLPRILSRDANVDQTGQYHIRSLYFDDAYDSALSDKIAGVENRDKYRIRIYNFSDKQIQLERKSKRGDYIAKTSIGITRMLAEQIMAGDAGGLEKAPHPLLRDMYRLLLHEQLRPAVIVDYVREPFTHPAENTRVTLDKQLRTGNMAHDLFDPQLPTIPVLEGETTILEVKYDAYLPDMLVPLLSSVAAQRSAISKYTLCRRYQFDY